MTRVIEKLSGQHIARQSAQTGVRSGRSGSTFGAALQQEFARQTVQADHPPQEIAFSKHAISRAEERGIEITPSLIDQIKGSMIRAQAKGAINILAVDAEKAFIINVPNAKVITAITQDEMRDSVFTNIDGAVFL